MKTEQNEMGRNGGQIRGSKKMYVTKKLSSSVLLLNYFTNLINEGAG
jgi:hypothetical protein